MVQPDSRLLLSMKDAVQRVQAASLVRVFSKLKILAWLVQAPRSSKREGITMHNKRDFGKGDGMDLFLFSCFPFMYRTVSTKT